MQRITIQPTGDLTTLGRRWRALEACCDPGFFRSWTFLGCQAEQRFAGTRLLSVTQDGDDVALALLGGRSGRAWLNQTGRAVPDSVFIEHNGLLCAAGETAAVAPALHAAARRAGTLVLSGVDDATLAAARQAGWLQHDQTRTAPFVALDGLRGRYIDTLSANTRAQVRRSLRLYGTSLTLSPAASQEQALAWFDEMVALHQAAWTARGHPGAFAHASIRAFHAALIARAWELGQAALLRVAAEDRHVGTLYVLVRDGRALSYQSGFAYGADPREKPGLVCHALAIQHFADRGARVYDLLGGDDRYKRSLAGEQETLHWGRLHAPGRLAGLAWKVRQAVGRTRLAPLPPDPVKDGRA